MTNANALVCVEVAAGRSLRAGPAVHVAGDRILLAAATAARLAADGVVVVLDEADGGDRGQSLNGCEGQPS